MNFFLPSLAMSKVHGLRLPAIKKGLESGKLSLPVLARQIIGRALEGSEMNLGVVAEYRASLAALSKDQQREIFPGLTVAVRSEIKANGFGDRGVLIAREEALLISLGLIPQKTKTLSRGPSAFGVRQLSAPSAG
jgi:hypothetical protein